jgi:hypothetical protein
MGDGEKSPLKKEENNPIKEEILEEEGKKLSRDIARKYIYVRNKEKYPLPFEEYKIYHIDGRLFNDAVENIYLCTKEQRNALYAEQVRRRRPFTSAKEIDLFLENAGKTSQEIYKDKRIYQKSDTRIPLYWRQKETRQRQIPIKVDPHPELREEIVKEIREAEENIEEKKEESRFYSVPPERHPELKKQLIQEIREAETRQKGIYKRKMTLPQKVIIVICTLAVIAILLFIFKDSIFTNAELKGQTFNISNSKLITEQTFNYEIRTDRYFILLTNNIGENINLEIKYNRYSRALYINENKTIYTNIPANGDKLIKDSAFSRDIGCLNQDCTVSIIYSKII